MAELKVPSDFKSEKEEADWWYDHRHDLGKEFARAAKAGTLRRGTVARLAAEQLSNLPLPLADLELARKQAQAAGVNAEEYMRALLHEALIREEEEEKKRSA